jgi:protoporphyrinogen oxidase
LEQLETIIIGAGLAGLSTALHLTGERRILERSPAPGGLATTVFEKGYGFDVTGHWLHMRDPDIRARLEPLVSMHEVERKSSIYAYDRFVAYPFQSNLKDVPYGERVECLMGAVEAHARRVGGIPEPSAFGDFVLHHFGAGIAREFMFPYNTKLWGVAPNEISHAWCQRFVPVPDLRQIVEGCFSDVHKSAGYNASFSYPDTGGIGSFSGALAAAVGPIELSAEVEKIHAGEAWLETSDGRRMSYRNLVSSMALPTLIKCIDDAPDEVRQAALQLACTSVRYFNLGIVKKVLDGLHWVYLPDPKLDAYRIGSFSNAVPYMAPDGCTSLYVELANDREFDDEVALDGVLEVLSAIGPEVTRRDVEVWQTRSIEHAYVIYDHAYEAARGTIMTYLESTGIMSIGRYGKWVYASMEDALMDGREAAARIEAN